MSPTARTLKHIRGRGGIAGVVERYNQYSRQSNDLFGCFDIIGIWDDKIVGIQCTSGSNHADRVKKFVEHPDCCVPVMRWLRAGGLAQVWSWRKLVRRNKDGTKSKIPRWAGKRSMVGFGADGLPNIVIEEI